MHATSKNSEGSSELHLILLKRLTAIKLDATLSNTNFLKKNFVNARNWMKCWTHLHRPYEFEINQPSKQINITYSPFHKLRHQQRLSRFDFIVIVMVDFQMNFEMTI